MYLTEAQLNEILKFISMSLKSVLLVRTEDGREYGPDLRQSLEEKGIKSLLITAAPGSVNQFIESASDNKDFCLIIDERKTSGPLENIYIKYNITNTSQKIICIYDSTQLHLFLDPSVYFAPLKNEKIKRDHLCILDVPASITSPKNEAKIRQNRSPEVGSQNTISNMGLLDHFNIVNFLSKSFQHDNNLLIQFLIQRLRENESFKKLLFNIIYATRYDARFIQSASTIFETMVKAGISLVGMDFKKITLKDINIEGAVLDGTDFSEASFSNIYANDIILRNSKLNSATLKNINFGRLPVLEGHVSAVHAMAISSDGQILVSSGSHEEEYHLRIWDLTTFKCKHWGIVKDGIQAISFIHGTKQFLLLTHKHIELWDTDKSQLVDTLIGDFEDCVTFEVSKNNQWLAVAKYNDTKPIVCLYNIVNNKLIKTKEFHITNKVLSRAVIKLAFSPNSLYLAVRISPYAKICLIDVIKQIIIKKIRSDQLLSTLSCCFSSDSQELITINNTHVLAWKTMNGELSSELLCNDRVDTGSRSCLVLKTQPWFIFTSIDGCIYIWDMKRNCFINTIEAHKGFITMLQILGDDELLCSAGSDGTIKLWPIQHLQPSLKNRFGHEGVITAIITAGNGQQIFTAGADGRILSWDSKYGDFQDIIGNHLLDVHGLALSTDYTCLASVGADGYIKLWNTQNHQQAKIMHINQFESNCVAFNPSCEILAVGSYAGVIQLWDSVTEKLLHELKEEGKNKYKHSINTMVFSPDGKYLFSGDNAGYIKQWEVSSKTLIDSKKVHQGCISSLDFSPNGEMIVSGGYDNIVNFYRFSENRFEILKNHHPHSQLTHLGEISKVQFSPSGEFVASASHDGTVCIWKSNNQNALFYLTCDGSAVTSLAFLPSGNLITGHWNRSLKCWKVTENAATLVWSHFHTFSAEKLQYDNVVALSEANRLYLQQIVKHESGESLFRNFEAQISADKKSGGEISFLDRADYTLHLLTELRRLQHENRYNLFKSWTLKQIGLIYCRWYLLSLSPESMVEEHQLYHARNHWLFLNSVESRRHSNQLTRMLLRHQLNIDYQNEMDQACALHMAADNNNERAVLYLCQCGANINLTDRFGRSPVHIAAAKGFVKIVRMLHERNADISLLNDKMPPPLVEAVKNQQFSVVEYLYAHAPIKTFIIFNKYRINILVLAVQLKCFSIVRFLVENGFDINSQDARGHTPLNMAVTIGHVEIARYLLDHRADPYIPNVKGGRPLDLAVQKGHCDLVMLLLPYQQNIDELDARGITLLISAVVYNQISVAKLLKERGAKINTVSIQGITAVEFAVLRSSVSMVVYLQNTYPGLFNTDDKIFSYILKIISSQQEFPQLQDKQNDVLKFLFGLVKNKNYRDMRSGRTFLMLAIVSFHYEAVKLMCTVQNINVLDVTGVSALLYAITFNLPGVVAFLLKQKADLNLAQPSSGDTPLIHASEKGYDVIVELLCKQGALVDHQSNAGFTALISATQKGFIAAMSCLLNNHADTTLATYNAGTNALISAAMMGNANAVELLLKHGANVAQTDYHNNTPLHEAVSNGHFSVVKYLVENCKDIDINAKNIEDFAPITFAAKRDNVQLFSYLHLKNADLTVKTGDKTLFELIVCLKKINIINYLIDCGYGHILKRIADTYYGLLTSVDEDLLKQRASHIDDVYELILSSCDYIYQRLNQTKKKLPVKAVNESLKTSMDAEEKALQEAIELSLTNDVLISTANQENHGPDNKEASKAIMPDKDLPIVALSPAALNKKLFEPVSRFLEHPIQRVMLLSTAIQLKIGDTLRKHLQELQISVLYFEYDQSNELEKHLSGISPDQKIILIIDKIKLDNIYDKYNLYQYNAKVIIICDQSILHPRSDASIYFAPREDDKIKKTRFVQLAIFNETAFVTSTSETRTVVAKTQTTDLRIQSLHYGHQNWFLNKKFLTKDMNTMQIWANRLTTNVQLQELFLHLILSTRNNPDIQIFASNIITAMCYANISFSNMDLSGISVPFAVLYHGNFFGANISKTNLSYVTFYNTMLSFADISNSNMEGAHFNELPFINNNRRHNNVFVYTKDGESIIVTNYNVIEVYDFKTLGKQYSLMGHEGEITALTMHPIENMVASAASDNSIRIWDLSTQACLHTFTGHTNKVMSISFNITGHWLVSGSKDKSVRLWDMAKYQHIITLEKHAQRVMQVQFSPYEPNLFVSACYDGSIFIWRILSGEDFGLQVQATIDSEIKIQARISSMCLNPVAPILAAGLNDGSIVLWNFETGTHQNPTIHSEDVTSLAFNSNGMILASGGEDETIRLLDASKQSNHQLNIYSIHTLAITCLQFHPKETNLLTSASKDGTTRFIRTGSHISTMASQHTGSVLTLALSKNELLTASGDQSGLIVLWNRKTGRLMSTFAGHTEGVLSLDFNAIDTQLVSGSRDRTIIIWDVIAMKALHRLLGHSHWVSSVRFTPNNNGIISGSWDSDSIVTYKSSDGITKSSSYGVPSKETSNMRLWDIRQGKSIHIFHGHKQQIAAIDVNPKANLFVSCSFDRTIRLWDLATNEMIAKLKKHSSMINTVKFNANGELIASGGNNGEIIVWDVQQLSVKIILNGHKGIVTGLYFFTQKPILVSSCHDQTIRFWDLNTGAQLSILYLHNAAINGIEISKDEEMLTISDDHTIKCWRVDMQNKKYQIKLLWSSPGSLNAYRCNIEGIKNITDQNRRLLKQLNSDDEIDLESEKSSSLDLFSAANLLTKYGLLNAPLSLESKNNAAPYEMSLQDENNHVVNLSHFQ